MPSLPQFRIALTRLDGDIDEESLGQRSKLGGQPTWIQNEETPNCPHCSTVMTFVGQLDSINHDAPENPYRIDCLSDDQKYMFGDVGLIYVFFCFECCQPQAVFQCY